MQHQDWQDLIPFYISQTLTPDQVRQFEAHLANCDVCQAEIDSWRMIASAVWREADEAAQQLPPLSNDVYNRLNYRDGTPRSRYSSNPPSAQTSQPANIRQLPVRSVPLTLIAGIVVAVVFGGLLLFFALRQSGNDGEVILMDTTPNSVISPAFGGAGDTGLADSTLTPSPIGVIPTQGDSNPTSGAPVFVTPTIIGSNPLPLPPQGNDAVASVVEEVPPENRPPLGDGPHLTLTPDMLSADDGLFLCEAFNPTASNIQVYAQPQNTSPLIGVLAPGDEVRVRDQSADGWYRIDLNDSTSGWVPPENAFLIGDCLDVAQTPIPTIAFTPSATEAVVSTPQIEVPTTDSVIVVNATYADIHIAPNFNSEVVAVATRNDQLALVGYQGVGVERWALVVLADGRQAWVWASVITEYDADSVPTTIP